VTVPVDQLTDPAVRALVTAVNAGDREAFFAALAPGATMSDDGTERNLEEWVDREIFSSAGHMEIESEDEDGRHLMVTYSNETYGAMNTEWRFEVEGGKVTRFETGQA
jgi:hypothetical protein